MSSEQRPGMDPRTESAVGEWLDDGPDQIPDHVLQDVLQQSAATPQARRRFLGRWLQRDEGTGRRAFGREHPPDRTRNRLMLTTTALVAGLAVLAVSFNVLTDEPVLDAPAAPATLTVAPNGGDYESIQVAVDAAAEGDTVLVMPGTYTEVVTITGKTIKLLGESLEGEVVIAAPADAPTFNAGSTSMLGDGDLVAPYALLLENTGSRVSDFTITGPDDAIVVLSGGKPRLRLSTVEPTIVVTHGAQADISSNEAGTIRVLGNSSPAITYNDLNFVYLEDHAYPTSVNYNTFVGPGPVGFDMAIFVANGGKAILQGNTITDPGIQGIKVGHNTMERDGDGSVAITNNTITGARQAGIEIHPSGRASILGNSLTDNRLGVSASGDIELIERNIIEGSRSGIVIGGGGSPSVIDNTVRNSDVGITVGAGSSPALIGNKLCDGNGQSIVVGESARPVIDESNEICDV